jgi:hypothetical protein
MPDILVPPVISILSERDDSVDIDIPDMIDTMPPSDVPITPFPPCIINDPPFIFTPLDNPPDIDTDLL